MEQLNYDPDSPFHSRILTTTNRGIPTANIKDTSVLKMIENSLDNGALRNFDAGERKPYKILSNFWKAVANKYEIAWGLPPKKSRLSHGVGIVGMGFVMDMITYALSERWEVPPYSAYLEELNLLGDNLPWTSGIWNFSHDLRLPWNELQNTSRHIDLVSNYLVRKYRSIRQREEKKGETK